MTPANVLLCPASLFLIGLGQIFISYLLHIYKIKRHFRWVCHHVNLDWKKKTHWEEKIDPKRPWVVTIFKRKIAKNVFKELRPDLKHAVATWFTTCSCDPNLKTFSCNPLKNLQLPFKTLNTFCCDPTWKLKVATRLWILAVATWHWKLAVAI